jgi:hypothetical protein
MTEELEVLKLVARRLAAAGLSRPGVATSRGRPPADGMRQELFTRFYACDFDAATRERIHAVLADPTKGDR